MLAQEHPLTQLSDYALDLLTVEERRQIDRHLQQCAVCMQRLSEERALVGDARKTLLAVSQPSPARLRQLAPAAPVMRRRWFELHLRPVLAFAIVLLLFAVSLQLYGAAPPSPSAETATTLAATATTTPTSTAEASPHSAVSQSGQEPHLYVPYPVGTPMAALLAVGHN